jgi:tRNA wybutosine-synthesizing protein 4
LEGALSSASWDPLAPTYVLCECVLVYMEPEHSAALVRWFGERCPRAVGVVYEQINPDDAFGRQMVLNLQVRAGFHHVFWASSKPIW